MHLRKNTFYFVPSFWALFAALVLSACSTGGDDGGSQRSVTPAAAYCPYLPTPRVFASPVTISGKAFYEWRYRGKGVVANGSKTLTPSSSTGVFSVTINGQQAQYTCLGTCSASTVVTQLKQTINASSSFEATATGTSTLVLNPRKYGTPLTLTSLSGLSLPGDTTKIPGEPNPIRKAEIRVTDETGAVVQCGETNTDGSFSVSVPANSGILNFSITSRSQNSSNTAYVMNNPYDNQYHQISTTVSTASNTTDLRMAAKVSNSLIAGAFNILDQIYRAQTYLRSETAGCGSSYTGCTPFTTAPLVNVYWTAGVSPGVYLGVDGALSFYLNGRRELYILGGENGDTTTADMDHFDNSVILHEYGHFLEDQFAKPDSPGGSHNGNQAIDPRLAWGEGFANFFQAAVTGEPYYRDTYGVDECGSSCSGEMFNEDLSVQSRDVPTVTGEGNFREFSVTRFLYDAVDPAGTSKFAEFWRAFNLGMRTVANSFKSITSFHILQDGYSGRSDWSSQRTTEKQIKTNADYATPLITTSGCSPQTVDMGLVRRFTPYSGGVPYDDGSFARSDQFRNNDFYLYQHVGGPFSVTVAWSGSSAQTDLDLYLYKSGYQYGNGEDMAAKVETSNQGTAGSETISLTNLAPGTYMINVMADTRVISTTAEQAVHYGITLNGRAACPAP